MNNSKWILLVGTIPIIAGAIFTLGFIIDAQAENSIPEIDQNQVEDEISRTIHVQLEDGLTSSDDIR